MFTQENISSAVNRKNAVRKKLLMDDGVKTSVGKRTVYELGGREFKPFCFVIFLFDTIRIFRSEASV
jgi:hypothetical protein